MKKALLILALAIVAALALTACNNAPSAPNAPAATNEPAATVNHPPLNVANWGLFIYEPVLQMFEAEYGIRVIYSTYSTNEELHVLITQGAEFDVIVPSDYMVERLINEGRLAPLNWENIPNASYIFPRFQGLAFDPDNRYSVPYKWGTFGIVYNTNKVDQVVDSWQILWDEQFAGEIFMYNSSRCTMGAVQRMLGFSMNSTCPDELNQVRDALMQQSPLVRAFLTDQIIDNMIGEEGALGTVYNGCARWIIYYNPDHNFVVPVEGSQLWFNSMVIPANTRNQANAEKFINFMNRPDIAYLNTRYTRYSTANSGAFERVPDYWQNCPIYWPDEDILDRGEVFVDLGDFRGAFELAWTQVLLASN